MRFFFKFEGRQLIFWWVNAMDVLLIDVFCEFEFECIDSKDFFSIIIISMHSADSTLWNSTY